MKKILLLFLLTVINMHASQKDAKISKEAIGTIKIVKDPGEDCYVEILLGNLRPNYFLNYYPKHQSYLLPAAMTKIQEKGSKRIHTFLRNTRISGPLYSSISEISNAALNNLKGIDHGTIPQNAIVQYEVFSDGSIQLKSIQNKPIRSKL